MGTGRVSALSAMAWAMVLADPVAAQTGAATDLDAQIAEAQARVAKLQTLKQLEEQAAALRAATPADPAETADAEVSDAKAAEAAETAGFSTSLGGIKFGAGLGFTYDLGNRDRVKSAALVNGVVRVTQVENLRARLMLESHYFFTPDMRFLGLKRGDWGIGPFVAVHGGADDVIEGVGLGMMIGLKRLRTQGSEGKSVDADATSDGSSFNLGVGVFYDLGAQTLGDGIVANQPLPAGETEVRFATRSQSGLMILTSFAF